ncbi:M16 family metallopeptidase [Pelatocladus sp. BLCC-F211]|uniref:M16 family metallopeptidase n=1 Tax=Pelatocladus sp. BLCC-F211 TaxID=3342752 RepID=UPI0035B7DF8C
MSVFKKLHRYRLSIIVLTLWLIAVLLLSDGSATSHTNAISSIVKIHKEKALKKTSKTYVTENVDQTVLENGLIVLTKEVHSAPVVSVQVWYEVGSRNEQAGVNGIAHQLEHMMFKGTKDRPVQFGRLFSALGSDSNAFTSYDQTAYYGTAERNKLNALLMLEADRMENSLIDAEKLASEKRVVISELQGYENSPEYRLNRAVLQKVFPEHPYGLPVGGTKADVEKFQVKQVQEYYRKFYRPDNAVLVIVGDFDTAKTLKVVKDVFGKIQKSQESSVNSTDAINRVCTRVKCQEAIVNSQKASHSPIVLREPGANALLQAIYPLPDANHPDIPALDVMDYILTEGRNSRLDQALVESGMATDVTGSIVSLREAGWYELSVTATPGEDLKKIDAVMQKAIATLASQQAKVEEVNRAKAQLEAAVVLNNRDITSQAMQLGNDQTTAGDYHYTDHYLAAVRRVTATDVQRVANKYLKPKVRSFGIFEPTQIQASQKSDGKSHSTLINENFSDNTSKVATEVMKYLPPVDLTTHPTNLTLPEQFKLSNGIEVLLLPDNSTPTVTLSGYIKAGNEFDPEDKVGLASLVAENLMNGTKTRDVLTIAKTLDERGASLDFESYREGTEIQGSALAGDLPVVLHIVADVVKNPTFPGKELELTRQQALTDLKEELDDPTEVAKRTFVQSVYPKTHPLHKFATPKSLQRIRRQDLIAFKTQHYRPDTTVLTLVGDFDPNNVRSLIEAEFGNWKVSGQAPKIEYPVVPIPNNIVRLNPVLPGKTQAVTYMGNTGINRKDQRYYAALVLNHILGGDTLSSRLGAEIRDRQGLTYGIYSTFQVGQNIGIFLIEMQTAPEDTTRAINSTRRLLEEIHQQGVTSDELETAKRTLISNYNVSLANPDELSYKILMNKVYGLDKKELHSFVNQIASVTLEQVNQAGRELLHPDKIVVVTAGPTVVADSH